MGKKRRTPTKKSTCGVLGCDYAMPEKGHTGLICRDCGAFTDFMYIMLRLTIRGYKVRDLRHRLCRARGPEFTRAFREAVRARIRFLRRIHRKPPDWRTCPGCECLRPADDFHVINHSPVTGRPSHALCSDCNQQRHQLAHDERSEGRSRWDEDTCSGNGLAQIEYPWESLFATKGYRPPKEGKSHYELPDYKFDLPANYPIW